MKKDVTLLEAMRLTNMDAYELIGVNKETKQLIKRTTSTIGSNALEKEIKEIKEEIKAIKEESKVTNTTINTTNTTIVDITPIDKPSDRFDIEDYIRYEEYMKSNGKKPSMKDYFEAIKYYTNGGK